MYEPVEFYSLSTKPCVLHLIGWEEAYGMIRNLFKSFRFEHGNLGPHRKCHAQLNKIAEESEKAYNKIRCSEEIRAGVLLNLNS